ncbi:MAG: PEP-CTERM sorting domain-containing protein [Chthoniobacterales bacterium]
MKITQFPLQFAKRSVLVLSVLLALPSLKAATTTNWNDDTYNNSTYTWEDALHWDTGVPTSASFQPFITHSTGNLTVTTAAAYSVSGASFIVNSGSLTLKLGGNFAVGYNASPFAYPLINNTTNNVANLVFDLNDFTLDYRFLSASANVSGDYFTLASTAADGKGTAQFGQVLNGQHLSVQNNVTLEIINSIGTDFTPSTFSAGSTLYLSAAGALGMAGGATTGFGNLIVGNSANANLTYLSMYPYCIARVVGNLTLNKGTTANQDSYLAFGNSSGKVIVGGNFTDVGGSATSTVQDFATAGGGSALIAFNGGAATQRTVSEGRTGLTNNFAVGENTTTPGNIGLAKSLATTGSFTMYRGSRLNVAAFTLTAGSLILADDAVGNHLTIADTFGTTNGLITTSGNLSLNTFNLELTFDGTTWTNGSNLLLFHYGGTFTGTLALGTITYNGPGTITSLGTLLNSGGNIYLQGVNVTPVPEPSTVFLLMTSFGSLIVWKLRRRKA